jgi:hypothetical protein
VIEVGEKEWSGIFMDFSEFGCFIQTRHFLKKDCLISFLLSVNPTKKIHLQGRVRMIYDTVPMSITAKPAGMGIEFVTKPEEYDQFIAEMRAKPH